jgi:hypothetical protein
MSVSDVRRLCRRGSLMAVAGVGWLGARSRHVDDCLSGHHWQFSSLLDKCLVGGFCWRE